MKYERILTNGFSPRKGKNITYSLLWATSFWILYGVDLSRNIWPLCVLHYYWHSFKQCSSSIHMHIIGSTFRTHLSYQFNSIPVEKYSIKSNLVSILVVDIQFLVTSLPCSIYFPSYWHDDKTCVCPDIRSDKNDLRKSSWK